MKITDSKYKQCLYFTSGALARKVEKLAIESWKRVDLSPSHAYLLMLVLDEPGIQPGVLAEELQLSPSTVTRLIEKLETKKLVIRTTEGKITNVYPTPKSKEMHHQFKECVHDFYENYAGILGKEESGRFIKNMNKVTDQLT
ncbi:MAG: MarR family transcriptional regulator [Chitinophagaceae bacterium]|jgi:DNA-binding MarR family transcriptional regulator|nr:MarR family transcriptional regulator [Chitinophagaceae bacterium]MCA6445754.1 MarR family transcriptional regulator [Chitinophagaceae bacterium]